VLEGSRGERRVQPSLQCEVCGRRPATLACRASLLDGARFRSCNRCHDRGAEPRAVIERALRLSGGWDGFPALAQRLVRVWDPCPECGGEDPRCRRCMGEGGIYTAAGDRYTEGGPA
jgi:hypothetical protein